MVVIYSMDKKDEEGNGTFVACHRYSSDRFWHNWRNKWNTKSPFTTI